MRGKYYLIYWFIFNYVIVNLANYPLGEGFMRIQELTKPELKKNWEHMNGNYFQQTDANENKIDSESAWVWFLQVLMSIWF